MDAFILLVEFTFLFRESVRLVIVRVVFIIDEFAFFVAGQARFLLGSVFRLLRRVFRLGNYKLLFGYDVHKAKSLRLIVCHRKKWSVVATLGREAFGTTYGREWT